MGLVLTLIFVNTTHITGKLWHRPGLLWRAEALPSRSPGEQSRFRGGEVGGSATQADSGEPKPFQATMQSRRAVRV